MQFIKPKSFNKQKVEFNISQRTRLIIEYYSKYTDYTEDEIVDIFMQNILDDKDFTNWLQKQRHSKKIKRIILNEPEEVENIETLEEADEDGETEKVSK